MEIDTNVEKMEIMVRLDDETRIRFVQQKEEQLGGKNQRGNICRMGIDALIWKERFMELCCSGTTPAAAFNLLTQEEVAHA